MIQLLSKTINIVSEDAILIIFNVVDIYQTILYVKDILTDTSRKFWKLVAGPIQVKRRLLSLNQFNLMTLKYLNISKDHIQRLKPRKLRK